MKENRCDQAHHELAHDGQQHDESPQETRDAREVRHPPGPQLRRTEGTTRTRSARTRSHALSTREAAGLRPPDAPRERKRAVEKHQALSGQEVKDERTLTTGLRPVDKLRRASPSQWFVPLRASPSGPLRGQTSSP